MTHGRVTEDTQKVCKIITTTTTTTIWHVIFTSELYIYWVMKGKFLEGRGFGKKKSATENPGLGWKWWYQSCGQGHCPTDYISERGVCTCSIDLEQGRKIGFILYDSSWQIMNSTWRICIQEELKVECISLWFCVSHDYLLVISVLGTGVDSGHTTWIRYFPSPIQILSTRMSKKTSTSLQQSHTWAPTGCMDLGSKKFVSTYKQIWPELKEVVLRAMENQCITGHWQMLSLDNVPYKG